MDTNLRQDLFQNILIRIWKGLNSFENRSSVSTWVYRISVNAGIDFLRKEDINHKDIKISNEIEVTDKSLNLEENLILSEKTKFVYKCINKLTFIDKTIITLYLEDLSYKEIAEVVGISEKYVSVKLTRIKKKLNECLKDH
jgi:RNA polymerase sigma-70 factor (ECF subfamily)